MDRGTFDLYRDLLTGWGAAPPPPEQLAYTDAAIALWRTWRTGELANHGRRAIDSGGIPLLAIWTGGPDHIVVRLLQSEEIEASLAPLWRAEHLVGSLDDLEGSHLLGSDPPGAVTLAPVDTRLPFILRFAFSPDWPGNGEGAAHRRGLIIGLALTVVVTLLASYGLLRVTLRERALAQQQSDFIATVSHEFRTPLTSMRHLTDLLTSNRAPDDARKHSYYQLLSRETDRLHRMVEGLLSFSRMQAGAYAWRLEPTDARDLVQDVVEEFRVKSRGGQRNVIYDADSNGLSVRADPEALSHAISNLLENADKYSDAAMPIRVAARRDGDSVRISIEDRGVGIPLDEQRHLFDRFARGAHARREGIRGLGLGLALVRSVAEAHGGSVLLESQPGHGSIFTLVIPCLES